LQSSHSVEDFWDLRVISCEHPLRILLVSTADTGGGAELSASNLFHFYRKHGHSVQMAVGRKLTADPDVIAIGNDDSRNRWARFWIQAADQLEPFTDQVRGTYRLRELLLSVGEPVRQFEIARGHEDFHFPDTSRLLQSAYDIVHCYNLHGAYFDLRVLPLLSRRQPVILDLRDAWLLSGHCSHSLGCERWRSGCGNCPDLTLYPALRRDGTAFNWRRKQRIFSNSQLFVATPSRWMLQKVRESMLAPTVRDARVIPTGIDLSIFQPSSKERSRAELSIPVGAKVLLFVANGGRRNMWKDYRVLASAFSRLVERHKREKIVLIALGDKKVGDANGQLDIRFAPHVRDPVEVAKYYQAADLYVHAAVADTFPRVILEALACGTPVVATGVGGIPEQIQDLDEAHKSPAGEANPTGVVVAPGDAEAMARGIERLLFDAELRRRLGENAVADSRVRFDLQKQATRYLEWYKELICHQHPAHSAQDAAIGSRVAMSSRSLT
jgi:glycosyltransferase involved in cell wall biosynthesis